MHMYTHANPCAPMYTHIHPCTLTNTHSCTYTHVHSYVLSHTPSTFMYTSFAPLYTHAGIPIYVHHAHSCASMYTLICMAWCAHAHPYKCTFMYQLPKHTLRYIHVDSCTLMFIHISHAPMHISWIMNCAIVYSSIKLKI